MDTNVIISLIFGLATFFVTIATSYFGFAKNVLQRVTALETKSDVYWEVLKPHFASIIHSPHVPRRDELMDSFMHENISYNEMKELECLLDVAVQEEKGDKKLAALFLLARVKAENAVLKRGIK